MVIKILKETYGKEKCPCGQITIGTFKEKFVMPLDYWTLNDYKRQWQEGLERIRSHDNSCLVATVQDPNRFPLIDMWVIYKIKDKLFIQNHMLCNDVYKEVIGDNVFTPENCYNFILPQEGK